MIINGNINVQEQKTKQEIADINKILSEHSVMLSGKSYYYKWNKKTLEIITTGTAGVSTISSDGIQYSKEYGYNDAGNVELINPVTVKSSNLKGGIDAVNELLDGAYFYFVGNTSAGLRKFIECTQSNNLGVKVQNVSVTHSASSLSIKSDNPSAYPQGKVDALTYYEYLGEFEQASIPRIETGSYVGTGTYGETNPNSLTFGFEPKVVIITKTGTYTSGYVFALMRGIEQISTISASSTTAISYFSWNGNTVSWYNSNSNASTARSYQLNENNVRYYYFALG